jgi:hypothetical protein
MNKHLRRVVREPRWREEAQAGPEAPGGPQEPGGPDAAQDRPEQDYSHNGTSGA